LYFVLETFLKRRARSSRFRLANLTAQVDDMHFAGRARAVAARRLPPDTRIANVIDLSTGTVLDSIMCFPPSTSPERRLPACQKAFPARFVEGPTARYLIYDLLASPRENQLAPRRADDHANVGCRLFPSGIRTAPSDSVPPAEAQPRTMPSDALCSSRNATLAFADRHRQTYSLMPVHLPKSNPLTRCSRPARHQRGRSIRCGWLCGFCIQTGHNARRAGRIAAGVSTLGYRDNNL
jgi:hypothetical protein